MIAVLIVNYRRATDTIECLESLWKVTQPHFHVFLADNGSGNADVQALSDYSAGHTERLTFMTYPENHGFAGAHNRLLQPILSDPRFESVLLLNNDTVVTPEFLSAMLQAINHSQRIEMIAARLLKYDDPSQVDSLGITFYKSGLASNRKSSNDPLLGPTGGCALYTMNLLQQLQQQTGELFDEQFFCYAEDTDLAWRAVLLGYRAGYAENAVVYHKGSVASGGPNSDFVLYHGIRNSLFVLVKDVPWRLIWPNLCWILLMHLAIPLRHVIKGKGRVVWRLYRDFCKGALPMWCKRRALYNQAFTSLADLRYLTSRSFYDAGYVRQALRELSKQLSVVRNIKVIIDMILLPKIEWLKMFSTTKFSEDEYLKANPDVAVAVQNGQFKSGREHYKRFGRQEGRLLRLEELTRVDKALYALDRQGLGLEIGPSHNPVAPKKHGFNVHILDHLSANDLRNKYINHGVNIDNIEEVDFVWSGQLLSDLIGKKSCYDWIIASHVIEHSPDLITFIQQCEILLKPAGRLSLIIPDKRYCFDHFNPVTSTGELLDAFHQKRVRPSAGKIFDHFANATKRGGHIAWDAGSNGEFHLVHSYDQARDIWQRAQDSEDYIDVHCWRFTPESFRLILLDLNILGLTKLSIIKEFSTSGCEFYITLGRSFDSEPFDRLKMLKQRKMEDT